jgi:predicted metal-dependent phosphoesterase TrpH
LSLSSQLTVDLHCHSNYSDGLPTVAGLEEWCLRRQAGLALTDHNEVRGSLLLSDRTRVPTLPAIEVGTREGLEFLVYFPRAELLEEFYRRGVEPFLLSRFMVRSRVCGLTCLEHARGLGGFVSLAHPFAYGRKSIGRHLQRESSNGFATAVLEQVQAIEVFNAGIPSLANTHAAGFYAGLEKIATLGSDAHTLSDLGNAGVMMQGDSSTRSSELFGQLERAAFEPLAELTYSPLAKTVAVIAWKHTSFFLLTRSRFRVPGVPRLAIET